MEHVLGVILLIAAVYFIIVGFYFAIDLTIGAVTLMFKRLRGRRH